MSAGLGRTIPAMPVVDVATSVLYYREKFGFSVVWEDTDFAILQRDEAVVHLWGATDDGWKSRGGMAERPIWSGAETFLAGTASCRIEVVDVEGLYVELAAAGVLHTVSDGGPRLTDYGTLEFATVDNEGNLIEFFRRETAS